MEKMLNGHEVTTLLYKRQNNEVSTGGSSMLCKPCSKRERQTAASVYCPTCNEFQCSECSNIHEVYTFMKTHRLVDANEGITMPILFDMEGLYQCDQHKEELKLFCEDDNQLCCSTCAIMDHHRCHSVVELQTYVRGSPSTSSNLQARLQRVSARAKLVIKITKSSKEQLDQDVEGISVTIYQMRNKVNNMFDYLKDTISRDAESFAAETLGKLTKKLLDCEKHIDDASEYLETIDNVCQNGTPSQQFTLAQKMETKVNKLCSNIEEACYNLETVTVLFDFDETLKLFPLPICDHVPGHLTVKHIISEDAIDIAHKDSNVKLTKIASVNLKQAGGDVEEPLYTGLDFLPDGRLVTVDNINRKCLIFNEKLKKVGSYKLQYMPQSVVAVSEDDVAITYAEEYKIDFLRVSKSKNKKLTPTVEVTTMYDSICLKDDNHFVAGTVDYTTPVRIVSMSGDEKNFSYNFPNKKYPLDSSSCAYIRRSDKVILIDTDEDIVYIYCTKTNTRVVVKDDRIKAPGGVAIGPSDSILVCSNATNTIVQISLKGRILSSYKLDMKLPYRVSVSKQKSFLAVTNYSIGDKQLQLYKIT